MRKMFCQALLLLSGLLFLMAFVRMEVLDELFLMLAMAAGLYVVMRAVRWLVQRVAPFMRWLVVLVSVAGFLYWSGREVVALGGDSLLVVAILALIIWAVLCPANPKRART